MKKRVFAWRDCLASSVSMDKTPRILSTMKTRTLLLPALGLFLLPAVASAELYCVSTAAQLASAIESADASASASEIRVRTGSYTFAAAPMQGSYRPHSLRIDGTSDLLLTGGWTGASCDTRSTLNPEQTVLSTGGAGKLMFIEFPAFPTVSTHTVEISGISFRNSTSADLEAACLHVENSLVSGSDRGTLYLDRNSFRLCTNTLDTSTAIAALEIDASNLNIYVRNNVFADNAGKGSLFRALARIQATFYISNNTLAFNPVLPGGADFDGLSIAGASTNNGSFFWVTNNLVWNTGDADSSDFQFTTFETLAVVSSNLFGRFSPGGANVSFSNNLTSDPRFISSNDLRLRVDSPARNSGGSAVGGSLDFDLFGTPRVQGGRIDRGAHEYDEMFANGFE